MARKKDEGLTLEGLIQGLKDQNKEMPDWAKKQIEAQMEQTKVEENINDKEEVIVQKVTQSAKSQDATVKVLIEIKNILRVMAKNMGVMTRDFQNLKTRDTKTETVAEQTLQQPNDGIGPAGTPDLRVISKNTGALLGMARDINVIRQNVVNLAKHFGSKVSTKADARMLKEGELREKANVAGGGGGGATPAQPPGAGGGFLDKLKGFGKQLGDWAKNLLALSAALWITAKAFQEFANVKWVGVIKGTVAMFMLAKAAKNAEDGDASKTILALGVGVLALAYGMNKFADVRWIGIIEGTVAMFALAKAAKVAGDGDGYKSILAIGAGVLMLAYGMDKFADVRWIGVIEGTVAMFALAKAAKAAGDGDASKTILALGVGTFALAYAFEKFASVPFMGMLKGIATMMLLAKAAETAGDTSAAATILAIGASVWILSEAFQNFAEVSWTDFLKGIAAMGALVVVTNLASSSLAGGAGMLLLAAAVWGISKAFQNFAELSWGDVLKGIVTIGVLAVGAAALAALALPIAITAGALLLLGGALVVVGAGLSAIGEGLESLVHMSDSIKELAQIDGKNLLMVAAGIGAISLALLAFGAAQMGSALANLVSNFLSFGQDSPVEKLRELSEIDGRALQRVGNGLATIADAMEAMAGVDTDNIQELMDALDDFPWLRATLYAKAGGMFNVVTKNAQITGGDSSKPMQVTPAPVAAPATASSIVKATNKAPITRVNDARTNFGPAGTRPLTKDEERLMSDLAFEAEFGPADGAPRWTQMDSSKVGKPTKTTADKVTGKSSELAAQQRSGQQGGNATSVVNAPTVVTNHSQQVYQKPQARKQDQGLMDYMSSRYSGLSMF